MSVGGYSKIERNETYLAVSKLQKISQILQADISQIPDFDASQIFNVSNNQLVQGTGAKAENMHFYGNDYKEKILRAFEQQIERPKSIK